MKKDVLKEKEITTCSHSSGGEFFNVTFIDGSSMKISDKQAQKAFDAGLVSEANLKKLNDAIWVGMAEYVIGSAIKSFSL